MSGFEIAGLVLAVFPIVVSGLSHFSEGIETIKAWKGYRRELAKYSRTLETERNLYLNTVERLFEGIIESNDELDELLEDPAGAFSQKPHYEEELRNRLGRSYDNYLLVMTDMLEALKRLRMELGIDEQGKLLWDSFPSLQRHVKKFKLVLSKRIYTESLSQIEKANRQLNHYTEESIVLQFSRSKRRPHRQSVDFKLIRRHAKSLYNVIVTKKSWKCRCWKDHMASLRLEQRPWEDEMEKGKTNGVPNLKFRVLLSTEQGNDRLGLTWKCQEIEVEPVESSVDPMTWANDQSQTLSLSKLSVVQSSKPTMKKKAVSFATSTACPPSKALWPAANKSCCNPGMAQITDICMAIKKTKDSKMKDIGLLIDESVGRERHDVYLFDEQVRSALAAKSLESLLETSHQRVPGSSLSRRDRLYIAVTLASSVLQLDGTSWLKRLWRSGDILFLPTDDPKLAKPKMDYAHPYISWKVSPNDEHSHSIADVAQAPLNCQIRNETLFALGITLIELSLKQNISELRVPEDGPPTDTMTILNTASRLVDDVYNESGEQYGDVVQRCLICPFNLRNLRNYDLDNEEFEELVFNDIFTPLRQGFEDFEGRSRIR